MTKNLFPDESLYPRNTRKGNMKIGALYALLSIITWSVISVITRFCLLNYDANILVFASMQIFAGGVALLLIRKPVTAQGWKAGVGYSWLYTLLQILRNFFLAAVYLYITSTETSLLINIEVVVTAILAYIFFKRKPHSSDIVGMLVITVGIVLFIRSLPEAIQLRVSILVSLAVLASCTRAIVVEKNHRGQPKHHRPPEMRDLRVHHVLGRHGGDDPPDTDRSGGTLLRQRTPRNPLLATLPAPPRRDIPPDDHHCRLHHGILPNFRVNLPLLRHATNGHSRNVHDV